MVRLSLIWSRVFIWRKLFIVSEGIVTRTARVTKDLCLYKTFDPVVVCFRPKDKYMFKAIIF